VYDDLITEDSLPTNDNLPLLLSGWISHHLYSVMTHTSLQCSSLFCCAASVPNWDWNGMGM